MKKVGQAAVLALVACDLSLASSKKDWEIGTKERLETRFKNVSAEGRVVATGPQLLSWEVFQEFVVQAYSPNAEFRTAYRRSFTQKLKVHGLGSDFWDRLEVAARPFLQAWNRQTSHLEKLGKSVPEETGKLLRELPNIQDPICSSRRQSLEAARQAFGEALDRFLYEAVAPTITITATKEDGDEIRLAFIEGGCQ